MSSATDEFFDGLARRGHVSAFARIIGTIRFDLADGQRTEQWSVSIAKGDVGVFRDRREADCVVSGERESFDRVASGEMEVLVALVGNELTVEGRLQLLLALGRLLPSRPGTRDPRVSDEARESLISRQRSLPADSTSVDEQGWAAPIGGDLVRILDGNTFVVSADSGDIEASPAVPSGLFSFDTRFLSTWVLTVNGERLNPLSVDTLKSFETRFFLVPGVPTQYVDATVSVIRERTIRRQMEEKLTVLNHNQHAVDVSVRLDVGCDFADVLEIQREFAKKGTYSTRVEDGHLRFGYQRQKFRREVVVSTSVPAEADERGLSWTAHLGPQGEWSTDLCVEPVVLAANGRDLRDNLGAAAGRPNKNQQEQELAGWVERRPRLETNWKSLESTYQRSILDLAALQYPPLALPNQRILAAGLPWFMCAFGRDSILTSLQTLPFAPELAANTIRLLAPAEGRRLDDFREEEPGKIFHEIRYGESTAFEEQPHSPYYGAADTTPLLVILLDEYERWTGDVELIREFEPTARAALAWIDGYADLMGNGYISYLRRNTETGLANQCWKESPDAISYRDGRIPSPLRATCELQGYAYDAKRRAARLARLVWNDPDLAARLDREAEDLKQRFNRDFWVEDGEYYALALDADGGQVDALSSNIGHLLWSGIVDESRADRVVEHLMGPRLFSGWGVRTLAVGEGRYNPVGYHVGMVWPFDNSFIAWGLRSYGFKEEAARIAEGILEAAEFFQGRLPGSFAGYDRELTRYPVPYPTASSPQAWSTGAPLLLIRTMLGLEPLEDRIAVEPALPSAAGWIGLLDVRGRWGRGDAFGRERTVSQY